MKISRFSWGVEPGTAATCLAIYGMVMSVIGAIGGVILFSLLFLFEPSFYLLVDWKDITDEEAKMLLYIYCGLAVLVSFFNIGWFIFLYLLYKKNSTNDVQGVEKIIKVGSYIIGAVQIVHIVIMIILVITFSVILHGSSLELSFSITT